MWLRAPVCQRIRAISPWLLLPCSGERCGVRGNLADEVDDGMHSAIAGGDPGGVDGPPGPSKGAGRLSAHRLGVLTGLPQPFDPLVQAGMLGQQVPGPPGASFGGVRGCQFFQPAPECVGADGGAGVVVG